VAMGCGDASPSTCSDEHSLPVGFLEHANNFQPSDLVVVDDIRWQPTSDGNFKARGGRLRIWSDWTPLKEDLAPRKFAYSLSPRFEVVPDYLEDRRLRQLSQWVHAQRHQMSGASRRSTWTTARNTPTG